MKITRLQQIPMVMVKDDPKWRNALKAEPASKGTIVALRTDKDVTGIGYASVDAPYKGVRPEVMETVLNTVAGHIVGQDPFNIEKILHEIDLMPLPIPDDEALRARMTVKSTIDIALHDLLGKAVGLPVYQLLGGLVREEIPVIRIMAIKEPVEMAQNASQLVKEGYRYLKVKLEGNPSLDVERIKTIREAVGPKVHICSDPNQSYDADTAIQVIRELEHFGMEIVEQPVPADDIEGLAKVSRSVNCLVEAHESAESMEMVFRMVKERTVSCIMIYLAEMGGLRDVRLMVDLCRLGDVKCQIACVGSRILSAACMHFVASTSYIDYACQVGEFTRFQNDRASGLDVENGMLRVPKGPGLGIQVDI